MLAAPLYLRRVWFTVMVPVGEIVFTGNGSDDTENNGAKKSMSNIRVRADMTAMSLNLKIGP